MEVPLLFSMHVVSLWIRDPFTLFATHYTLHWYHDHPKFVISLSVAQSSRADHSTFCAQPYYERSGSLINCNGCQTVRLQTANLGGNASSS